MKEHETSFVCGLTGPTEVKSGIVVCVFCGATNPDAQHLESHNISACPAVPGRSPSFKRRYDMVAHLKQFHGASDAKGLAERWRHTLLKRAWSCGFCISPFACLAERLRHIDQEHFAKHHHISHWDRTKVIQGLLLQPQIDEAWSQLLMTYGLTSSTFSWNNKRADKLQVMLQKGPSSEFDAADLAKAAFDGADDPDTSALTWKPFTPEFYNSTFNTDWNSLAWIDPSSLSVPNLGHLSSVYASMKDSFTSGPKADMGASQNGDPLRANRSFCEPSGPKFEDWSGLPCGI